MDITTNTQEPKNASPSGTLETYHGRDMMDVDESYSYTYGSSPYAYGFRTTNVPPLASPETNFKPTFDTSPPSPTISYMSYTPEDTEEAEHNTTAKDSNSGASPPAALTLTTACPPAVFVTSQPYGYSPYPESSTSSQIPLPPYGTSPYADVHKYQNEFPPPVDESSPGSTTSSTLNGDGHSTAPTSPSASKYGRAAYDAAASIPENGLHDVGREEKQERDQFDLLPQINGMFRLLDLYSETSSGGLVDKIVIAQDSLRSFVNQVMPGAYKSVTKIDFAAMDRILISPVGIYGSKSEIIRFLLQAGAVTESIAALLSVPLDTSSHVQPHLRSGIYVLLPPASASTEPVMHIIYWPEDSTWDDAASGSVRKNRVTFIRYLTRLADQLQVLISPEHAASLVWKGADTPDEDDDDDIFGFDPNDRNDADDEDDSMGDDRVFRFEVSKTNEQEEDVKIEPGFKFHNQNITAADQTLHLADGSPLRIHFETELAAGETSQAFITSRAVQPTVTQRKLSGHRHDAALRSDLKAYQTIIVSDSVTDAGLHILMDQGDLRSRMPELYRQYQDELKEEEIRCIRDDKTVLENGFSEIKDNSPRLKSQIRLHLASKILDHYPVVDAEALRKRLTPHQASDAQGEDPASLAYFHHVCAVYPEAKHVYESAVRGWEIKNIKLLDYQRVRNRFIVVQDMLAGTKGLTTEKRQELVRTILPEPDAPDPQPTESGKQRFARYVRFAFSLVNLASSPTNNHAAYSQRVKDIARGGDADFLRSLNDVVADEPLFLEPATLLRELALDGLEDLVRKMAENIAVGMRLAQDRGWTVQAKAIARNRDAAPKVSTTKFRKAALEVLGRPCASAPLVISSVTAAAWSGVHIEACSHHKSDPLIERSIWALDLTEDDKGRMKDNPTHVPSPRVSSQPVSSLSFPPTWHVRHCQLMASKAYLLVVDTPAGINMWLVPFRGGISFDRPTKHLPFSGRYAIAVDEQLRTVALVLSQSGRCDLQVYMVDDSFSNIQSRGSPFSLMRWYLDGTPDIISAAFFCGTEELCLVESSGRIRVFSLLSQSFRPAVVQLPKRPLHVQCSPDGSALLVVEDSVSTSSGRILRALHHASFGSGLGIVNSLPPQFNHASSFSVTSLEQRGRVFLTAIIPSSQAFASVSVLISTKETEYRFRLKGDGSDSAPVMPTVHNSLIDCFSEVWARYPVVAAIQRNTISSKTRLPTRISFVSEISSDVSDHLFDRYFRRMVKDFETTTRKPTNQRLEQIRIEEISFEEIGQGLTPLSRFKSGEWLAELLCLIPIHIAVTRENRFVPLKDGVFNSALEQQLLGADISRIIESITLGWYESIFSSYMATKPVKVISSMGEQSVGKSYSLNHVVDSSFAGSAVRTTEGVWLSVCPTRDLLVVALDFEGVHSIERTAQEDMLLVLFNTALSNLILFRNNFALSRDVANMFTSFQASTNLFDPASNPKLFKGLLAIVIKDVVDGDKKEIVKEFSSKFYQIVTSERANNFISVLHDSQLTVIPWSVIQSREFYTLFGKVSKMLIQQRTTHASAGEFLITLKTLMAKMKAQDWGSIDQTAIKHRVALLMAILPAAFSYGKDDEGANSDELKNMDNQDVVPHNDTPSIFHLQKDQSQVDRLLSRHISEWDGRAGYDPDGLRNYLRGISDSRILHVKNWLDANTARFPSDNADVRSLRRAFEDTSDALRSSVQICFAECTACRLRCVLHPSHLQSDHDCGTSHRCLDICDFPEEHDDPEECGLQAGHEGRHICDGAAHLCGGLCHLDTKKGCQKRCALPIDHMDDEHMCSARTHQCGEPCDARDMPVPHQNQHYSCTGLCTYPYDEEHDQHGCENRQSCPIKCALCQRLCSTGDHFHGLEAGSLHLCGQEHACGRDCEAAGICEVNTTPHSVETTFTGRHDTFQYTKYTQVANRLACAVAIPSGELLHMGPHVHSTKTDTFHYCEEVCANCGYICTLPLGHRQSEHDTAHGSMERTAWAIEGKTDATVEVQGRMFGAQDGGAPQLCSAICRDLGRHAHIDYCRNVKGGCQEPESEHINETMVPNPNRPKDWVSHKVFWARSGFRDPYSKDEQTEFALCDVQCAGPEHQATATVPAHPSFCTLPIFHPPQPLSFQVAGNNSYVSNDGHAFGCPNPNSLRQAYHVIFVLDKSGSMSLNDRRPLPNQPSTPLITRFNDNRFGAVLSAAYGFWLSKASGTNRRDSYSVITFDGAAQTRFVNDFTSTPDQLLARIVQVQADGGTHFDAALASAQTVMDAHWSTDRAPVIIFLSDGECGVTDDRVFDICNRAVARGKPLSFHSVSFGTSAYAASLRRMVTIAEQVAQAAPRDPHSPLVPCTFAEALDSIRLAETFLAIADSLKKPRASLIRS